MPKNYRWLLLPPAVALLIVLGPLTMQSKKTAIQTTADKVVRGSVAAVAAVATPTVLNQERPTLPRTPDAWQITSTLVGLLLLGGAGLYLLRRLQNGSRAKGTGTIALRQSVRLSARQAVHAIEFEGKLMLIGEGERGITLLATGTPPEHAADEAIIAARELATAEAEDDGAVPKNLVIPRPAPAEKAPTTIPMSAPKKRPSLGDFRALLAKAGRQ
ncbi:MAG: LPXTG cell wall anchor domain-containing protein [Planctomycetes bacterium]|nr:LPXTG cell wall anchor domain-containing protein [Planctomycetota bacterium]